MYQPSLFGGLEFGPSTSSAGGGPARTSRRLARVRGSRDSAAACGLRCSESSPKCDPLGCSLKMYLLSECGALTQCSVAWKDSGTPAGLSWLVLGRSGPRTSGTEFGSWQGVNASLSKAGAASPPPNWPTVHGNQGNNGPTGTELGNAVTNSDWMTPAAHEREATPKVGLRGETNPNLAAQVNWVTPTECERKTATSAEPYLTQTGTVRAMRPDGKSSNMGLTAQVAWPTPQTVPDSEASHNQLSGNFRTAMTDKLAIGQADPANPSTPGKPRGSLNAAWVAQLMGWPDEYYNALAEAVIEYHLTAPPPGRTRAS